MPSYEDHSFYHADRPAFKQGRQPEHDQTVWELIEGTYTSDVARVEKALHPEYRRASVQIIPTTGKTFIQRDAASSIIEATRARSGAQPKENWNVKINVLDIMDGLAFAELVTPATTNYLQLAKIDGEWKIINTLRKPTQQPK